MTLKKLIDEIIEADMKGASIVIERMPGFAYKAQIIKGMRKVHKTAKKLSRKIKKT